MPLEGFEGKASKGLRFPSGGFFIRLREHILQLAAGSFIWRGE
jgi:hypothetical protein